jgi:hypothetical protein
MKLTNKTLTKDVLPLLTKELLEEILDKVPAVPLDKPLLSLTVGEFGEIIEDEETYIVKLLKHRKALKAFGLLKQYRQEIEAISKFFKLYETKKTQEETNAALNIKFPSFSQRILIDCVKWFHLKSMEEAEKIKISEWLTMWQDEASAALYQHNYSKLLEQKNKAKRK